MKKKYICPDIYVKEIYPRICQGPLGISDIKGNDASGNGSGSGSGSPGGGGSSSNPNDLAKQAFLSFGYDDDEDPGIEW